MGLSDKKLVQDTGAFLLNIFSSVGIIFINKKLMSPSGYGFNFATTLCALHFMTCAGGIRLGTSIGMCKAPEKPTPVPWGPLGVFVLIASASIASLNISLMLNTVGIYQIAKLLIVPFTCFLEMAVFQTAVFTLPMLGSVAVVLAGVGIVTVTHVDVNLHGLVWAALSVVASGLQQVYCGQLQRKFRVSSHDLLSKSAPIQALLLFAIGPFLDNAVTKKWVHMYEYNVPALMILSTSCLVAVLVNLSQFFCLGRFSAVTFQVLGHLKTVLVIVGGWTVLGDPCSAKQVLGCSLAVVGMVMYGYLASKGKAKNERVIVSVSGDKESGSQEGQLLNPHAGKTSPAPDSV